VIDPKETSANVRILQQLGANVDMVSEPDSAGGYLSTRIERAQELQRETPGSISVNQYANERNWLAELPLLSVWRRDGLSLEAHVQNSLVHLDGGWPAVFFVRDMEGTSASRERVTHTGLLDDLPADSPVVYDDEAWMRLKYYLVTNHLGHLVHVLARYSGTDESVLWGVVRSVLASSVPDRYVRDLLESPTLPAKANLISRFAERGEPPLYVAVPNPMLPDPTRTRATQPPATQPNPMHEVKP
jgi:siderophore synthetase component